MSKYNISKIEEIQKLIKGDKLKLAWPIEERIEDLFFYAIDFPAIYAIFVYYDKKAIAFKYGTTIYLFEEYKTSINYEVLKTIIEMSHSISELAIIKKHEDFLKELNNFVGDMLE